MKVWDNKISDKYCNEIVYVTRKIDGVNATKSDYGWLSRAGKPLYNLPDMPNGTYEVFLGDFKKTISACRTRIGKQIDPKDVYMLSPFIDPQLVIGELLGKEIKEVFHNAIAEGYEGLVIHANGIAHKLKQKLTFDCIVNGIQEGTGKHKDRMGALIVILDGVQFKVGTGFTDKLREEFNDHSIIGKIIEVEAMEQLPSGKLRHPRFIRIREDLK